MASPPRYPLQFILFLFTISIFLLSCSKPKNTYTLNQKVKIFYRNRVVFRLPDTTLYLRFAEFEEESRCPPKNTCVWEGLVKVGLNYSGKTEYLGLGHQATLEMDSVYSYADYGNYRINLLDVGYTEEQFFGINERSFVIVDVELK
jgi:hypothetical protein